MAYPSPGDGCVTSLGAIYQWYRQFLGRPPRDDVDAIGWGRVGQPCEVVYNEISGSQEAINYSNRRAACQATPGMQWIDNDQGGMCIVGPAGPIGPPPGSGGGSGSPPPPSIPGLQGLIDWLRAVFDAKDEIMRKIAASVADVAKGVGDASKVVSDTLTSNLGPFMRTVSDVFAKFNATVGGIVQGLIPTTLGLVGAALGGVESIVGAFLNNAASIDDIVDVVAEKLTGNKVDIGAFLAGAIGAAFEGGLGAAVNQFTEGHPNIVQDAIDAAMQVPNLSPRVREVLNASRDYAHSPAAIFALGVVASTAIGVSGAMAEPDIENARMYANWLTQAQSLDTGSAIDGYVRGFIAEQPARDLTKLKGLKQELFPVMAKLRTRQVEVLDVFAAYFRGAIDDAALDEHLKHLGYDDQGVTVLKAASTFFPGPSDLIRFALRDVFTPAIVERFGLDQNFPVSFLEQSRKAGLPEAVAKWYWMAHWNLPSVQQGFEMLQRGYIQQEDLRFLLQANDVMPFWRENLLNIAYNPLTRVDLRRMDKLGTINDAQLLKGYRDIGYNAENAKLLFDFTKAFNSNEKKTELKDITDGLKARVITAVINGTLDEKEAGSLLTDIGYGTTEQAAFFAEARLFRQETISKKVAELIGDLFIKGHRTEQEATTALAEHGYLASEIELIMRQWKLEKELKTPDAKALAERDLSSSNIITAFVEGGIDEKDARSYLTYLRYDAMEVDVLISSAAFKRAQAEEKEAIEAIHVGVLSGRITEETASGELSAANVPARKRDSLLAKWALERHGKVEKIPLSSLKDIYARGLWDDAKVRGYLFSTGYSEEDISALLILWGSQAEERAAREAAAKAKAAAKTTTGGATA